MYESLFLLTLKEQSIQGMHYLIRLSVSVFRFFIEGYCLYCYCFSEKVWHYFLMVMKFVILVTVISLFFLSEVRQCG